MLGKAVKGVGLVSAALGVSVGLGRSAVRRAGSEPVVLPELPDGWVDEVTRDLVRVDVERWRRFTGTIVHSTEADGKHWLLTLTRGGEWDVGTLRNWWRSDDATDTVPQLVGSLRVTDLGIQVDGGSARLDAGPALPGSKQEALAAFEVAHTQHGRNEGILRLRAKGRWWQDNVDAHLEVVAPAPTSELLRAPGDAPDRATAWSGFPPPLSAQDAFAELPLSTVQGATTRLDGTSELGSEPAELLIGAHREKGSGGQLHFVLRVSADTPLDDEYPELANASEWNRAEAAEDEYLVERWSLEDDELRLSGPGWSFVVRGERLRVRVEALGSN